MIVIIILKKLGKGKINYISQVYLVIRNLIIVDSLEVCGYF